MAGFEGKRRILMVGGEGVVLFAPGRKGIERETAIAWSVPDFNGQLAGALTARNPGLAVTVIFDGADQAYRKEENVPKLSPFDRPRFIRRKLELAFPSYPIRAALELKAQKPKAFQIAVKKAPDVPPAYLFAALPETEQLDRVGDALFEAGVPVSGFGLLPVESSALVTALADRLFGTPGKGRGKGNFVRKSRWSVLVGQHETGGLRQVVVKDGRLALSRLTPPPEQGASGPAWAEEVLRGFRETLAYVSRLGYTPDDGIDAVVVCGEVEKEFFDARALAVSNFKCIGVAEALTLIGAKTEGAGKTNFADALHAAWIAKKRALDLPVRVPSIHRVMAPRLFARIGAIALVMSAIGLGWMAVDDYQSYFSLKEEVAAKENQQVMMQREYDEESKAFAALPVAPEVIKGALAVKEMLEQASVDPAPILNRLKDALEGDVVLRELELEHAPPESFTKGDAGVPDEAGKVDRGRVKLAFSFTLPEAMPLEQKVLRAEMLEKRLIQVFPEWSVSIDEQFGNMSRTGALTGGAGSAPGAEEGGQAARFTLEGAP